ncbi:MAG TPA: HAMP domain-containing methyl-accepting chemotaxis protein [Longimicrobiales bacterium]
MAAFAIASLGTLAIFFIGYGSLKQLSEQVTMRSDTLYRSMDLSNRLEAAVLDQIAVGEHNLVSRSDKGEFAFDSLHTTVDTLLQQYAAQGLDRSTSDQLNRVHDLHTRIERSYQQAHQDYAAGRTQQAVNRVEAVAPNVDELRALIRALSTAQAGKATAQIGTAQLQANERLNLMRWMVAVMAILLGFLIWSTLKAVDAPLHKLVLAANRFGDGDLNVGLNGNMPGEFRVLAGAFTGMADRFRQVVGETVITAQKIGSSASDLSSISEQVAASSGQVSTAMVGISSGAEQQAAGLRTVNQALEDIRRRADEIDVSTQRVRDLSEQIRDLAESKRIDVGRALSMLLEVRTVVQSSRKEVGELERASEKITNFVETIQGLARQTNLLALNAAIEAARAGEHGRGFAVVAEEVRKLADGSARAADEVASTVRQIRTQIESVVSTMEVGATRVAGVEEASKGAEQAFEEIVAAVRQVREAAANVAAAADDNQHAVTSVEQAVHAVNATAESHAASAQEVSAAAEQQSAATEEMSAASVELLHVAERLRDLVSGFRV